MLKEKIERIDIFQNGGIGDLIIALPWLNYFEESPEPVYLLTNYPEIAALFLKKIHILDRRHTPPYFDPAKSCLIELADVVNLKLQRSPSLFLRPIYEHWLSVKDEWSEIIRLNPMKANEMAHKALGLGLKRKSLPFYFIGKPYGKLNWEVEPLSIPNRFITLHDGFDASGYYKFEASTKSWDIPYWERLVEGLKQSYPDIAIVQLGGLKHRQIKGVDLNLAGALEFQESLRYLNSSLLHIDGDSGLVHARYLFNKPSVVLFGPTNVKYFGYEENINLAPKFCGDCWWTTKNWMENCPKTYIAPLCMQSHLPGDVLNIIKETGILS